MVQVHQDLQSDFPPAGRPAGRGLGYLQHRVEGVAALDGTVVVLLSTVSTQVAQTQLLVTRVMLPDTSLKASTF